MFVCICAQVSESQWWYCLEAAKRDWTAASAQSGAGQNCGQCRPFLQEISRLYVEQAATVEHNDPTPSVMDSPPLEKPE